MKRRIASVLLFLAIAPAAQAVTITDETPARAITIAKHNGDFDRVFFSNEVVTMKECRDSLADNAEAMKDNSVAIICLPADLTQPGRVEGKLPAMFFDAK